MNNLFRWPERGYLFLYGAVIFVVLAIILLIQKDALHMFAFLSFPLIIAFWIFKMFKMQKLRYYLALCFTVIFLFSYIIGYFDYFIPFIGEGGAVGVVLNILVVIFAAGITVIAKKIEKLKTPLLYIVYLSSPLAIFSVSISLADYYIINHTKVLQNDGIRIEKKSVWEQASDDYYDIPLSILQYRWKKADDVIFLVNRGGIVVLDKHYKLLEKHPKLAHELTTPITLADIENDGIPELYQPSLGCFYNLNGEVVQQIEERVHPDFDFNDKESVAVSPYANNDNYKLLGACIFRKGQNIYRIFLLTAVYALGYKPHSLLCMTDTNGRILYEERLYGLYTGLMSFSNKILIYGTSFRKNRLLQYDL